MSLIRRTMAIASLVVVIATGQSLQDCLRHIHDSDAKKRLTAVGLLGTFPQDDTVVAALIGALKDQTEAIRITAARVLAQNRTNAAQVVPVLEQMLDDPSSLIREGMAEALGKFGAEAAHAIPALEKLLSDPEILVRLYAIRSLGALAGTDKHAQGMIVQQLQDSHADIRRSALIALSGFGEASNNYLPQLLAAIKDPTDIVRNDSSIRDAIREISIRQAHAAVPLLIAVLNDPAISFEGRAVAVQTLGEIGPPAQGASADLQKACSDCPNWFGKVVEDALVKISPEIDASSPEGLAKAIAMLSREDAMSQQHARNALNKAGVIAVPPLLELLRKPQSESVTVTGLHTLGEITIKDSCRSTPAVISTAVSMLTASAATEVKRQAALILGHCKPFSESVNATVVAALTESLKDQGIREDVLWALGNLGQQSAGAVPAIQEIMKRSIESEPMDRKMARTAMFTLGQLGPSARSAAPLIFKLFKDQDLEVRSTAMIALGGIEDPSAVPLLSRHSRIP